MSLAVPRYPNTACRVPRVHLTAIAPYRDIFKRRALFPNRCHGCTFQQSTLISMAIGHHCRQSSLGSRRLVRGWLLPNHTHTPVQDTEPQRAPKTLFYPALQFIVYFLFPRFTSLLTMYLRRDPQAWTVHKHIFFRAACIMSDGPQCHYSHRKGNLPLI